MKLENIRFSGKARSGVMHANPVIWQAMGEVDKREVVRILADLPGYDPQIEGRSIYYPSENPILTNNCSISGLRIKGFDPVIENGQIMEHRGAGFVKQSLLVDKKGALYISINEKGLPERGALARDAQTEFTVAQEAGSDLCDWPIAYGEYDGFRYEYESETHHLGFSIFGFEGKTDYRLETTVLFSCFHDLTSHYSMIGRVLRTFHGKYVHRYLSRANIGMIFGESGGISRVVLRDLDSAILISSLTPLERYGFLLIDILRIIYQGIRSSEYASTEIPLWQYFMQDYLAPNYQVVGREINLASRDMYTLCEDVFGHKKSMNLIERVRAGKSDFSRMLDKQLVRMARLP